MATWVVKLKDPLTNRELFNKEVKADTEYEAKRSCFTYLVETNKGLPKVTLSEILPYLKIKKVIGDKENTPIDRQGGLDLFFKEVRLINKVSPSIEDMTTSIYFLDLIRLVTKEGLEEKRIPEECPICRNSTKKLVIHHWKSNINLSIQENNYRRTCFSCNTCLGLLYKGKEYPDAWSNQFNSLLEGFKMYPKTYSSPLLGTEGSWSLLSDKEWKRIIYIWENTPRAVLRELHRRPLKENQDRIKNISCKEDP